MEEIISILGMIIGFAIIARAGKKAIEAVKEFDAERDGE